jgi:hypothetical protein
MNKKVSDSLTGFVVEEQSLTESENESIVTTNAAIVSSSSESSSDEEVVRQNQSFKTKMQDQMMRGVLSLENMKSVSSSDINKKLELIRQ